MAPPPLHGATTVGAARGGAARPSAAAASGGAAAARRPVAASAAGRPVTRNHATAAAAPAAIPNETIHALTEQMDEMKMSVDTLEKERDFYFSKVSASANRRAVRDRGMILTLETLLLVARTRAAARHRSTGQRPPRNRRDGRATARGCRVGNSHPQAGSGNPLLDGRRV